MSSVFVARPRDEGPAELGASEFSRLGNWPAQCIANSAMYVCSLEQFLRDAQWERIRRRVVELADLEDEEIPPPKPAVIKGALRFIGILQKEEVPPPHYVVPSYEGTLSLDWNAADRYVEAEILDEHTVEWHLMRKGADKADIQVISF